MLSTHPGHRGTGVPLHEDGDVLLIDGQSQMYSIDTDSNDAFDPFDLGGLLGKWGLVRVVQCCSAEIGGSRENLHFR